MGTSHTVIPAVEVEPWGDPTGYFASFGIALPAIRPASRRPTKTDLDSVLRELPHLRFQISRNARGLDYDITDPHDPDNWGVIWLTQYDGNDSDPVELYFHQGDPALVLELVDRLSKRCGPILVMLNNEEPRFVGI